MLPRESRERRQTPPPAVNSGTTAPQGSPAYAAPQLVALGQALDLVQGCLCCACYQDCYNCFYYYG